MDESHTQAEKSLKLHKVASDHIQALISSKAQFSLELKELSELYGVSNAGATKALTEAFPANNNIKVNFVFAGNTSDQFIFLIKITKITVLASEEDIDKYYLGKEADERLRGMQKTKEGVISQADKENDELPTKISPSDFKKLQSRLLSNCLALAVDDSKVQNNVSTVLLI